MKHGVTLWPGNCTPERTENISLLKNVYKKFIAASFTAAKVQQQPRCSPAGGWGEKVWHGYTIGDYSAIKRNEVPHMLRSGLALNTLSWVKDARHKVPWLHLHEMSGAGKSMEAKVGSCSQGLGWEEEGGRVTTGGYWVSFWGERCTPELHVGMTAGSCEYTKTIGLYT